MTDSVTNTDEFEPTPEEGEGTEAEASEAPAEDTTPSDEVGDDDVTIDQDLEELEDLESLAGEVEDSLDAEMTALREEFEKLNDRHLRLAAEFNNYRRRVEQERLDVWGRAQADLVGKLTDVLDDLQRVAGLDLENATVEAIMEGIDLVERKFMRVLEDAGIQVIDPVGDVFDPERMEAMMRVPAETEEDDDKVAQVFQKGYEMQGVLVRPARVGVFKHG